MCNICTRMWVAIALINVPILYRSIKHRPFHQRSSVHPLTHMYVSLYIESGTAPLVVYQGPKSEAEAAKLCGLEGEYSGGNSRGRGEEKQEQRRRAAL